MPRITDFQTTCFDHRISTSFCITQTEHIAPKCAKIEMMTIRFWANKGKNFNLNKALQDGSVVFSPYNGRITFSRTMTPPFENRTEELKEKVNSCVTKLLSCLEEETFPTEQQRIRDILGNTVVILPTAPQQEMNIFSSQSI